ncbi:uncharacterized protein KQ657_002729 [Scheffersomyces spartinae]|uniref:Protein-serine/threonine kinase n=1 Tax=Scheffersomyces spartinae TaxID=45513 RepID=A0A9P7V6E3_9ASCO|nr:uncharacterized protein KQ657_002729 [Scheffersomyces spartinae]KAG7191764.1 hypothetical protein KQ657_002729 [Scheffersomyces spartinae]
MLLDRTILTKSQRWCIPVRRWRLMTSWTRSKSDSNEVTEQQRAFLKEYKIRSSLEGLIMHYSQRKMTQMSIAGLYEQSEKLTSNFILQNANATIDKLLVYNARRLKEFRKLPYLVVLNPSISETYNQYLMTMSLLLEASINPPLTLEANGDFCDLILQKFIDIHADTLPVLSKGFEEVSIHLPQGVIKSFLDVHLRERIHMRLIAHQHMELSKTLQQGGANYVKGGKYNGVIKLLNIKDVIKKNAELVNDICFLKYDQTVALTIDTNLYPPTFWSKKDPSLTPILNEENIMFPYIEYHLDYILMELFKNSFRAHIENGVQSPVQATISISNNPMYLEMRIRDRGKGISPKVLNHIFDYSYTTFETNEGEAYKTLNSPPGDGANVVAGMGYGLPLLKAYIELFNDTLPDDEGNTYSKGLLSLQTYYGLGTDVYLKTVGY